VDVGVVFGVHVTEFGMEGFIACSRQSSISFVDLDERVTFVEVDIAIVSWQP
jgi:hypothetical protein